MTSRRAALPALLVLLSAFLAGAASAHAREPEPAMPPIQVVVLVDESRRLSDAEVAREREAARVIASSIPATGSVVSVAGFGSADGPGQTAVNVVCKPAGQSPRALESCVREIQRRRPGQGAGADHAAALQQALSLLRAGSPTRKIVFLLTGGGLDVRNSPAYGDSPARRQAVAQAKVDRALSDLSKAGAQVWPLGFGDVDRSTLSGFAVGRSCTPVAGDPTARTITDEAQLIETLVDAFSSAACVKYTVGTAGLPAVLGRFLLDGDRTTVTAGEKVGGTVSLNNSSGRDVRLRLEAVATSPGVVLTVNPAEVTATAGTSAVRFTVQAGESSPAGATWTLRLVAAADPREVVAEQRFGIRAAQPVSQFQAMSTNRWVWSLVGALLVVSLVMFLLARYRGRMVGAVVVQLSADGAVVDQLEAVRSNSKVFRFAVREEFTGTVLLPAVSGETDVYEVRRRGAGFELTSPDGRRIALEPGRRRPIGLDLSLAIDESGNVESPMGTFDPFAGAATEPEAVDPFGSVPAILGPPTVHATAVRDAPSRSGPPGFGDKARDRPTAPGSRPPSDSGPRPETPRLLVGHLPSTARLGAEVSLTVRIVQGEQAGPGRTASPMRPLLVGPNGAAVTVIVESGLGLTPLGPLQQEVRVPPHGDSDPVRFAFRATTAAMHHARVTAWAGGTFLAELAFEISIADRSQEIGTAPKTVGLPSLSPHEGEVTLQVRREGHRYSFQLLSSSQMFAPVLVDSIADGPDLATEAAITTLRRLAAGDSSYSPGNARRWLQNTGLALWNSLVPEAVRDQFWQLRSQVTSFTIATGTDTVPWELLYPMKGRSDEGFLIERFPVTRRVYNQRRADRISLGEPRFVVPGGSPANAQREIGAIQRILSAGDEPSVIADLTQLLDLLDADNPGLLHFACHNTYRIGGGGSSIAMADGDFLPTLLETAKQRESLAERSPLVFINACRSAGEVPHYTNMMGFAQQFLAAGAGAFVGTLWDVRSDSAQTFAEEFYQFLVAGKCLGDAAWLARRAASSADDDPTWLAYTVYGDPHAVPFGP